MVKLINNHSQPLSLEGGVILAAAGTEGSEREVEALSEFDRRRLVDTGRVSVIESKKATAEDAEVRRGSRKGEQ